MARWNPIFDTALFVEFENEMREALKQDQEPTDAATLDRLLPGIRERLAGIDESVATVRNDVKRGFEDVKEAVEQGFNSAQFRQDDSMIAIGASLINAGTDIINTASPPSKRARPSEPMPAEEAVAKLAAKSPPADSQSDEMTEKILSFQFKTKYDSLQDLFCHWYGEGKYEDGLEGVAGRNMRYGKKWRKDSKMIVPTQYSRIARVIKAIADTAKHRNVQSAEVIREWEPLYEQSNKSVHRLVEALKTLGIIQTTKARGRNTNTNK